MSLTAAQRVRGGVLVTHPGPSLLVTLVTIIVGGLARHGTPSVGLVLRLGLIMLPAQLAIGALNDLADERDDAIAKPSKPLVAGTASRGYAIAVVAVGTVVSLGTAASVSPTALLATGVGLGAGLGYDVGAKRSPASLITWWAGFAALPVGAYAAADALRPSLLWVVPLAALLATTLHVANALPDLDGDRLAGVASLPVRLGRDRGRRVAVGAGLGTAALVGALARPLGQGVPPVACAVTFALTAVACLGRPGVTRPFPVLAVVAAILTVTWLVTLPG